MPQKIYFDESGFTGNNLLNEKQILFSYGSIASSDEEAKDFVEYLIKKYNVQSDELKGTNLIKYSKGRKAISEIFNQFEGKIKISLSNKKYALAGKFFEYIFEPCISPISTAFYRINFHRFISNFLYVGFVARGAGVEEIFTDFEKIMRNTDDVDLNSLFSSSVHPNNSPIISNIREFAIAQKSDIENELKSLPGDGIGKWILDLTDTALFTLLANWGTEYDQLTAICDVAKPLNNNQELFNVMINRTDKKFTHIGAPEVHPLTFNLSGPIQMLDSNTSHGIQLADVIASASVYAATKTNETYADEWKQLLPDIAAYGSIFPEEKYVDLNRHEVQLNTVILEELHNRATKGKSLIEGIPEFIADMHHILLQNPLKKIIKE